MPDSKYWLAVSQFTKFGPVRIKKLLNFFPKMQDVWEAEQLDLQEAGIEEKLATEFIIKKNRINPDQELEKLKKENINFVKIIDSDYPKLLKEIYAPPSLLYYKGNLKNYNEYSLAVVGTRKFSSYGKQVTQEIVRELGNNGFNIVSGLALGIDTEAHFTAVSNNLPTFAVLGSGLSSKNIYPSTNRYLAEKIIEKNGIIFSEYPINMIPLRHNFPQRNRIISGLSLGSLIIEAGQKSGALITAQFALEQNREIFTIPGSIFSKTSIGTNNLLKKGAHPITSTQDILDILNLGEVTNFKETKKILPDNPFEEKLLQHISKEPIHIDKLTQLTNLKAQEINSTLINMELKGKIKNLGNMSFILNI